MALTFTNPVPRWEGSIVEPDEAKKTIGWLSGDRPPAQWENWYKNYMYQAVTENREALEIIDTKVNEIPNKNFLINGNYDIWQRGTAFADVVSTYTADRWIGYRGSFESGLAISRELTDVDSAKYCARVKRTPGNITTGGLFLSQTLESKDTKGFQLNHLTVSFLARKGLDFSAIDSSLGVQLLGNTLEDTKYGSVTIRSGSVTITSDWQKYFVTTNVVVPNTVKTITLQFASTQAGTAGANDYFEVTNVKLEKGSVATDFIPMLSGEELALCQRYYEKTFSYSVTPANGTNNYNGVLSAISIDPTLQPHINWRFSVSKRITPTVTLYNPRSGGTSGQWTTGSVDSLNARSFYNNEYGVIIDNTNSALGSNLCTIHAVADSEL